MIDEFNAWMNSSRAGNTYLVLVGIALLCLALAKLFARSDPQSQAARVCEFIAIGALGIVFVILILAQSINV